MDQFDKAEIRAEKERAHRIKHQPLSLDPFGFNKKEQQERSTTLHLPQAIQKPSKTPSKRTNEIGITVYVDGEAIEFTARVNLNDLMSAQRTRAAIIMLFRDMLASKFGRINIE